MQLKEQTHKIQSNLANYCRGANNSVEASRKDRLHHYKRLVFNNIFNVLESAYPITHKILGEKKFKDIVQSFFEEHNPSNPQYWKFPKELIDYVENNKSYQEETPYINDLLFFEWAEIEVHAMPNIKHSFHIKSINDVLDNQSTYRITPYHMLLELDYPIHQLVDNNQDLSPKSTFILVYRKFDSFDVQYFVLSPLSVITINLIQTDRFTKHALFNEVHRITSISFEQLEEHLPPILNQLSEKQIIAYL